MHSLAHLPFECVIPILEQLHLKDLICLRQTCAHMRDVVSSFVNHFLKVLDFSDVWTHSYFVPLTRHKTNTQAIKVSGCISTNDLADVLKSNKSLTDLALINYCRDIKSLDMPFQNLTVLHLSDCREISSSGMLNIARNTQNLICLQIDLCKFSNAALISFAEKNAKLRELDMGYLYLCGSMDSSVSALALHCPDIELVNISIWAHITDQAIVDLSQRAVKLKNLNLHRCYSLTDSSVSNVVQNCVALESLNVSTCAELTDASFDDLCCVNLKELHIDHCRNITDATALRVARNCLGIQIFAMSGCRVTDQSIIAVGENLIRLKVLNLTDCRQISDKSLRIVFKNCADLEYLNLSYCHNVSDNLFQTLVGKATRKWKKLNLLGCILISEIAICCIAQSSPFLESLNVSFCPQITDKSLIDLSTKAHYLKEIKLEKCVNISDKSITRLARNCGRLLKINFNHCKLVTQYSIKTLQQRNIEFSDDNSGTCMERSDK